MSIQYRKLLYTDTDVNIINCIQINRGYKPITLKDMYDNNWIVYGAFYNDTIIGITFLFPYQRIPHTDYPNGKIAELGGTYVLDEYRNHGIGFNLVQKMINELHNDGVIVDAIVADSTDQAYNIYKKLGFIDSTENRIWFKSKL